LFESSDKLFTGITHWTNNFQPANNSHINTKKTTDQKFWQDLIKNSFKPLSKFWKIVKKTNVIHLSISSIYSTISMCPTNSTSHSWNQEIKKIWIYIYKFQTFELSSHILQVSTFSRKMPVKKTISHIVYAFSYHILSLFTNFILKGKNSVSWFSQKNFNFGLLFNFFKKQGGGGDNH
jgi:hypothetical protein